MADLRYEHGREASRLLGNGIEASRAYDAGGRLSGLAYSKNGTAIAGFGFGFDPVGNLSTIQRSHEAQGDEAMQYTADHQLEDWSRGAMNATGSVVTPMDNQNWALDSRGNWTGWSHEGVSETRIHSGSNEMAERRVGVVGTLLAWDSAGNLVSDGQRTFQWNHKGQLQSIAAGMAAQGQYGYDPVGRRTVKTAGGLTTISVYDGWQCIWQKVTGSGTDTTKTFLYGNYIDEPIAMVRSWGTTLDTVWYLQGNNYNVEALTNRTGAIVERYAYTPYGEPTVYTAAGTDGQWFTADDVTASVSAKGNALTFQGRELDAESGVYYFRNRYYSAQMGRFVSRDPIRLQGDYENTYRQEYGAPFDMLDPAGLNPGAIALGGGVVIVVTVDQLLGLGLTVVGIAAILDNAEKMVSSVKDLAGGGGGQCEPPGCKPLRDQIKQLIRGAKSNRDNIEEHLAKIEQYKRDPMSMDNQGRLKTALEMGRPDLIEKIIAHRIDKELMGTILRHQQQLKEKVDQIARLVSQMKQMGCDE